MELKGKTILIVEDEIGLRELLSNILKVEGFSVISVGDISGAREVLRTDDIYLVITDVMLPDFNGIDFTREIKASYPLVEVIVLTAFGNVKDGVKAMKLGAFDYLTKGDGEDRLPLVVSKAIEKATLTRQLQELERRLESKSSFSKLIGKSSAVHKVIDLAKKVAVTDTTVLLMGETGTGKELLAEAIHLASRRRKGPFIAINCAAIPKDLQESELFGHKKGAFTGANADKKGYFEVADRGTIFLDELGEMSADLQAKLLRALEMRIIHKVGDTTPVPIDVRFIAATNSNLLDAENNFRKDLYYRLSTFTIDLPPLRERRDDIELLALHFINVNAEKMNKSIEKIAPDFLYYLKANTWRGNIRELKNVIERAVILSEGKELSVDTLPDELVNSHSTAGEELPSKSISLRSVEKQHIIKVLKLVQGNKTQAAKMLDIGLATLYRKIKEYELE